LFAIQADSSTAFGVGDDKVKSKATYQCHGYQFLLARRQRIPEIMENLFEGRETQLRRLSL
jgi:hypothetical protein